MALVGFMLSAIAGVQAADMAVLSAPPDVDRTWIQPVPKGQPALFALTFDDGPVPGNGGKLLDVLKEAKWSATFCVQGNNITKYPEAAKRMLAEGHELAGHSWSHQHMSKLDPAGVTKEIADCLKAIRTTTGVEVRWYRAPFLDISPAQRNQIRNDFHCGILGMTLNSNDWVKPPPPAGEITKLLLGDRMQNGVVVLCHEWSKQTLNELPGIIAELTKRNFRSVTVSQLQAALKK